METCLAPSEKKASRGRGISGVSDDGAAAGGAVVLVVLVLLLAEEASAESAMMVLLQEAQAQWCSSCWCFFSRRRHQLGGLGVYTSGGGADTRRDTRRTCLVSPDETHGDVSGTLGKESQP
jgi:hypothetical protein